MATSIGFDIFARDGASPTFLKVAASAKLLNATVSDLGTNVFGLTKLVGGAGLIPVLAGAAGAATELGTALGAAAGAGGIFALSAGGIFMDMQKARQAINVTDTALSKLTPGTAEYTAKLKELHQQQRAFNQDFGPAAKGYDAMTAAFSKFKKSTSGVTENVMGKGFKLIASVLPRLAPVSNAAGHAIGGLLDDLKGWTKSPAFSSLLKWFETSGPKAITHFGHSVGNILSGLGGILKNFVGPGDKAAGTLERLTKRFSVWGNSKGVSDSVDKFLKYISSNGGKITSVLSSLAKTAPKLAVALGGLGSTNLSAISMFLNLLSSMPQGVFNVVIKGLFGIVVASKALNIVMGVNALLTGMQGALKAVEGAAIGTRLGLAGLYVQEKLQVVGTLLMTGAQKAAAAASKAWAGAQWLLNAALDANPIGITIVAVAALVAGIVIAYKKSETFRKIVQGAFHAVAGAAQAVFGWIKSHWKLLAAILGGPIVAAAIVVISHWDKIKAGAANLWAAIKSGASRVKDFILTPFQAARSAVQNVWQTMRQDASNFVGFVGEIPGRIKAMVGRFTAAGGALIKGLYNGILAAARSAGGFVSSLVSDIKNAINSSLHLPLSVNFDKGPLHIHATVIPALAKGGIVNRPTMALIGEAGPEAVVPLSGPNARGIGGGDVYVTVNASGLVDPAAMARTIQTELLKLKRQHGSLLGLA
jgi:phage-related protein